VPFLVKAASSVSRTEETKKGFSAHWCTNHWQKASLAGKSAGPRPWTLCKWYGYSSCQCRTVQTVMCDTCSTAAILLVLLAGSCSMWCRIFSSKLGVWMNNGLPQFAVTGLNVLVSRRWQSMLTNVCLCGRCSWGKLLVKVPGLPAVAICMPINEMHVCYSFECVQIHFCKTVFTYRVAIQCQHKFWRCKRNHKLRWLILLVGTADTDVRHQVAVLYDLATTFPPAIRRGNNKLTDDIWSNYYWRVRKEESALTRKGGFFGPMLIWTFSYL
jgi:hypothetical protein